MKTQGGTENASHSLNYSPAFIPRQTWSAVALSKVEEVEDLIFYLRWKKPDGFDGAAISMFAWFLWIMWIYNNEKKNMFLKNSSPFLMN